MTLRKYLIVGASAIALCPVGALAQDNSPSSSRAVIADDIIVTATRRESTILQTPMSITAYNQEALDVKGIRNIEDLARMTPGVSLNEGTFGIKYLVVRGLTSSIGATMNGVYIDDTPIQVRSVSLATNFYPAMFDLERVEILRGPQGTLYGAGSMGGAIRFITAKPGLQEYSGYARAELGFTEGGAPSYEAGAAVGGPIVQDKIGFRVSGYYRRDGGYIDRVPIIPSRGTARKNQNERDTFVGQAALTFKPTEDITITPSVFYQQADRDNSDQFWDWRPGLERPGYPEFTNGDGLDSYGKDRAKIYSVKGEFDFGSATIITNTAFIDRKVRNRDDGTAFYMDIFGLPADFHVPGFDERASINLTMRQRAFTQELRVQSNPGSGPLSYVAGLFYQNSRQSAVEFDTAPETDGPFLFSSLGIPVINGTIGYLLDQDRDRQFAVFGNLDYKLTDKLTVSAGIRYSYVTFDFKQVGGYKLPTDVTTTGRTSENPITPKFAVEYQASENLMLYANAAKGFRPGGSNSVPTTALTDDCLVDLANLGYSTVPKQYKSDSTWSYEVGAKGRAGRWLTFAGDVFQIDWNNVQRARSVLNCGNPFIDNLGKARVRGVEAKITLTPVTGLTLDTNLSYNDATARETLIRPAFDYFGIPFPEGTIITKGDRFAPKWIISVAGDYETAVGMGDTIGYGHIQFDYRSGYDAPTGNVGYNIYAPRTYARHLVAARIGARTGGADISLFVNNLLNSKDEIGRLPLGVGGDRLPRQVYRPRTWGMTASYRF